MNEIEKKVVESITENEIVTPAPGAYCMQQQLSAGKHCRDSEGLFKKTFGKWNRW